MKIEIDIEDREQAERLVALWFEFADRFDGSAEHPERMQAALRGLTEPVPVWTVGDIVQHPRGNYTAQRHKDGWRTTSQKTDGFWATDKQVTNWVGRGSLLIIRQQSMEDEV